MISSGTRAPLRISRNRYRGRIRDLVDVPRIPDLEPPLVPDFSTKPSRERAH